MNVGQLKEKLAGIPDDTPLMQLSGDHQAVGVSVQDWFVSYDPKSDICFQYFTDEDMSDGERKVRVVLVE